MARAYELPYRYGSLSFKHHKVAAPLEDRLEWLKKAGKAQEEAAAAVGVARETVKAWEHGISNGKNAITYTPLDLRISVPKSQYESIYKRLKAGEAQTQVAADSNKCYPLARVPLPGTAQAPPPASPRN